MKVIDTLTAQLETLGRDLKALPGQLDCIAACRDLGVQVPPNVCGRPLKLWTSR